MKNLFAILSILGLVSCTHVNTGRRPEASTAQLPGTAGEKPLRSTGSSAPSDFPILDAHTHFHSKQTKNFDQPSKEMLEEFRKAGVVGAVVHLSKEENDSVKINREAGPKFAICAGIVPGETAKAVEEGLKKSRYQCMKVYLGYVPLYPSDKFYQPFYKLAEQYKVPVVFHTGDTYDKMAKVKFADPLGVDEVAVTYPKVKFVIAHMGNPWFDSAAEVVYKNDNVYVDTSALLLGDVSKEEPEKVEELVIKPIRWFFLYVENPKKFLFGTDWPLMDIKPYVDAVKKAIPQEHWRAVFYENTAEVFGIKTEAKK